MLVFRMNRFWMIPKIGPRKSCDLACKIIRIIKKKDIKSRNITPIDTDLRSGTKDIPSHTCKSSDAEFKARTMETLKRNSCNTLENGFIFFF